MKPPTELLEALASDKDHRLQDIGKRIGQIYTDHGLPIDMALERLDMTKQQKLAVLSGAQNWLIEHRLNSNATDTALERQRKANRDALHRFIKSGETGIY